MKRYDYVRYYEDRRGQSLKMRGQFRRNGYQCSMPLPNAPDFHERYAAALLASERAKPKQPHAPKHSLDWCIIEFCKTPEWRALGDKTQKDKERLLKRMSEPWGHMDMVTATKGDIIERLDKVPSVSVRNRIRGLFVQMFDMLESRGVIDHNPAARVKRLNEKTQHTPPWSYEDVEAFERKYKRGTRARLAYELHRSSLQASVDVCRLRSSDIHGDWIRSKRQKTGVAYEAPVSPALKAELAMHPKRIVLLQTEAGAPFSEKGYNNWFNDLCRSAGIAGRSHGLRVLGCVEYAESGCTAKELMAVSGHETLQEAQRYIEMASKRVLAKSADQKRQLASIEGVIGYRPKKPNNTGEK